MAHIHDLAPQVTTQPNYVEGRKHGDRVKFPDTDVFKGFNLPSRLEGEVFDLEFDGVIPREIDGTVSSSAMISIDKTLLIALVLPHSAGPEVSAYLRR